MYGSWHTECDRQNFLSFWTIFCSFTTLKTQKIKDAWRYYHFTKVNYKWQSLWCMVPEIWNVTDRIFFHFGLFFALTTRKIKILKNWKKNSWNIIILYKCTKNDNHMMSSSWHMKHDRQNFFSVWTVSCPFTLPPPKQPKKSKS